MKYVAETNSLSFGNEVKLISNGDPEDFNKYIWNHQNKTLYGVLFCVSEYWIL